VDPLTKVLLERGAWSGPGNVNLFSRPIVKNPDGSTSTVDSLGINVKGKEVLIPQVSEDARHMSSDEAIEEYNKTGRNLGTFSSIPESNFYAEKLHNDMESGLYTPPLATSRKKTDPDELNRVLRFLLSRGGGGFNF
jgi:hypothetical protein